MANSVQLDGWELVDDLYFLRRKLLATTRTDAFFPIVACPSLMVATSFTYPILNTTLAPSICPVVYPVAEGREKDMESSEFHWAVFL